MPRPNVAALIRAANREPPLRDCLKHYRGLSGLQDEDVFPLIMQALFTPSGALRDRMRLVMRGGGGIRALGGGEEEMEGGVGEGLVDVNKPYVAIHARLGYGVGEIRTAGRRFRLENYGVDMTAMGECFAQKAWEMARRNGVSDRFYLATDTIEFRDVLYAGLRRRMERAVLMFGEWDVKHVRDLKGGDEDDLDRYVNTFVEVLLLAGGLGIIHLRSGFADLAIWMGAFKGGGGGRIEYEDCRRFVAGGKQGMNDSMVVR